MNDYTYIADEQLWGPEKWESLELNYKNKIFFSLNDYIMGQLKALKIKNIEIIKKDTYNQKNNFFSSRRSKKNNHDYGRNISVIMIK